MLFEKPSKTPREVVLVRSVCATDFTIVDKWSNILLTVTFTICWIVFVALVIGIAFFDPPQTEESFQAEMNRIQAET